VLVEVLLLRCGPGGVLAYRREAAPLDPGEVPDDAAARIGAGPAGQGGGLVAVLHSTSWRHRDDGTIVLTYAALPDPRPRLPATVIGDLTPARGTSPRRPSPPGVRDEQVAAHAARHLALLAVTDPVVRAVLEQFPEMGRALAPLAPSLAGQLAR